MHTFRGGTAAQWLRRQYTSIKSRIQTLGLWGKNATLLQVEPGSEQHLQPRRQTILCMNWFYFKKRQVYLYSNFQTQRQFIALYIRHIGTTFKHNKIGRTSVKLYYNKINKRRCQQTRNNRPQMQLQYSCLCGFPLAASVSSHSPITCR